ncbi:hypothetical protein HPB48_007863 [Haemaphysalis longicornis]|uniref:Ionotropic receptor n=1 Tax=Haemaphysalis longicornis TaxID=44386 RepID=A0A9J6GS29_HAELO|nr:hypothetical protein HPB48_007863 [Haemaphysalis longicornis]
MKTFFSDRSSFLSVSETSIFSTQAKDAERRQAEECRRGVMASEYKAGWCRGTEVQAGKMLFIVLVLCVRFSISDAQLYPLVLDVMANLNDQEFVAIAAFGDASKLLAPYISVLPKPIWLWTGFHQGQFTLPDVLWGQERRLSKVIIFLPWLLNIPKGFPDIVKNTATTAVKTHWVISTAANKSLDWIPKMPLVACQVVFVSPTHVDEPVNGFADCNHARRNTSIASEVFRLREGDAKKYPRNLKLTIVRSGKLVDAVPEVAALMEAYAVLNTSLIKVDYGILPAGDYAIMSRDADINVEPKPFFKSRAYNFYFYAMYPPCHICFFTRIVTGKGSLLPQDSANLVVLIFMFFVLALAIIFVSLCVPSGDHPNRLPEIITFLVSTFLGRSPKSLRATGATLKALLSLWMFGTLIAGFYVQSHITADIYAPRFSREVEDIQELDKLLDAKRVLPCVDISFYMRAFEHLETPLLKKVASITNTRPQECIRVDGKNGCYGLVHRGKHVYVRPCCSYDEYIAFQQGLVKGRGSLQMYHRVATMLPNFPQRRQHRRLLLAISESGMDFQRKKRVGLKHLNEDKMLIPRPFSNVMWVFLTGCVNAVLVFCFEIFRFRVFRNDSLKCGS